MSPRKTRLDILLVEVGLARSRSQAQHWINNRQVEIHLSEWILTDKPSTKFEWKHEVPLDQQIRVTLSEMDQFVSRAGYKLDQAIIQVEANLQDCVVLDVGQSSGGFTDALLKRGVQKVVGIEVGHGQLDEGLRQDDRVFTFENTNARDVASIPLEQLAPNGFDWVVMDVSFISQTLIWDELLPFIKPNGKILSLVKPQFEVGSDHLGKGGIVKNPDAWEQLETSLKRFFETRHLQVLNYFESPILGGDGNKEFFIHAKKV